MYDFSQNTTHFHDSVLFSETLIYSRYYSRVKISVKLRYGFLKCLDILDILLAYNIILNDKQLFYRNISHLKLWIVRFSEMNEHIQR